MRHNRSYFFLGALVVLTIALWSAARRVPDADLLRVHFFDVGQGDSIFIEAPDGNQILIDGGPDTTVLERLGAEMGFFDRSIDLVVLTHPDRDHMAGLMDVLERYKVEAILTTDVRRENAEFHLWQRALEKEGARIIAGHHGMWTQIAPGVGLFVFSPDADVAGKVKEKTNDTGLVLKLVYGSTSFLFTADIEQATETALVGGSADLHATVLKVGHHGSKTSSSESFLSAVVPQVATISVGRKNSYGHPHPDVIGRLKNHGIEIFRTDLNGTVQVTSNGEQIKIVER